MQTKQTTGRLATVADGYVTIVKQACNKLTIWSGSLLFTSIQHIKKAVRLRTAF